MLPLVGDRLSGLGAASPAMMRPERIDKQVVECLVGPFRIGGDMFQIEEKPTRPQQVEDFLVQFFFPLVRQVVDCQARHDKIERLPPVDLA